MKSSGGARERILRVLEGAPDGLSLQETAALIERTPPPTHRLLQNLASEGRVERRGEQKEARYRLRPGVRVEWTHRSERGSLSWYRAAWHQHGVVDWRFPLASRIPDERGRDTVLSFLRETWHRGYLTPWLLPPYLDLHSNDSNLTWAKLSVDERAELLKDPSNHGGIEVIAFGSCVRDEARDHSDVDVIAVTPVEGAGSWNGVPQFPYEDRLHELADAINLGARRTLDLKVFSEDRLLERLTSLDSQLQESIITTGITVFSSQDTPQFIETQRRSIREAFDAPP